MPLQLLFHTLAGRTKQSVVLKMLFGVQVVSAALLNLYKQLPKVSLTPSKKECPSKSKYWWSPAGANLKCANLPGSSACQTLETMH